jgi:hypothetical protein
MIASVWPDDEGEPLRVPRVRAAVLRLREPASSAFRWRLDCVPGTTGLGDSERTATQKAALSARTPRNVGPHSRVLATAIAADSVEFAPALAVGSLMGSLGRGQCARTRRPRETLCLGASRGKICRLG